MSDLIDREALLTALATQLEGTTGQRQMVLTEVSAFIRDLPGVRATVVANMTGGVLQGASCNCSADLLCLDYDEDGIEIEGGTAELSQVSCLVDPAFVQKVIDAAQDT